MSSLITRVRALIAKAESSPFPAEADAFMAKAQKLINDHAIDQARLNGADVASVGHEQLSISGAYSRERSMIWGAVARANRCQVLTMSSYASSKVNSLTLIGRAQDRELVRMVATSLEMQAIRRMGELDVASPWATPVVQRRSFLRGFASEVGDRLARSGHEQPVVSQAVEAALVLAAGSVDRYVDEHFNVQRGRRGSGLHDGMAYSRGRRAGASADVGATRLGAARRGLPPGG